MFPGGKMKTEKIRRYTGVTVPLGDEEKDLLQTLAFAAGKKPATMARSLFYRGVALYLKDRRDEDAQASEPELHDKLRKLVQSDRQLETVYKMIRAKSSKQNSEKTGT
jgi:hypothetical protein